MTTLQSLKWLKEKVFETAEDEPNVPYCDKCGGVVRPDIVFFGESLPNRYFQNIKSDFQECDLLLVLGTSLTVMPFANLITESKSNVPRVYINLSKPGSAGLLGKIMGLGKFLNLSRCRLKGGVSIKNLQDQAETHKMLQKLLKAKTSISVETMILLSKKNVTKFLQKLLKCPDGKVTLLKFKIKHLNCDTSVTPL